MTVEVYDGPGTETYRSSLFTVTVNSVAAYVYGYTRTMKLRGPHWANNADVEVSWVTYGADETTTIVVSLADEIETITSAAVYPEDDGVTHVGLSYEVSGGSLTITCPENLRLRVEVNGDRGEVLHLFGVPLRTIQPGGTYTDWSDLGVSIASVDTVADTIVTTTPHGLSTDDKIVVTTTTTMPTDSVGQWDSSTLLYAIYVDTTTIQVARSAGGSAVDITGAGSGTLTLYPGSYADTGSTLYIPAGEWKIGRLFHCASDVDIYISADAVVEGSFDLRDAQGVTIRGAGTLTGLFSTPEYVYANIADFNDKILYCMFLGENGSTYYRSNSVTEGLTVIATPHYVEFRAAYLFQNVHVMSPWHWHTDGLGGIQKSSADQRVVMTDVFQWTGDDNFKILSTINGQTFSLTNCYAVAHSNTCYHLGYNTYHHTGTDAQLTNCHASHIGEQDIDSDATGAGIYVRGMQTCVKAWTDETTFNRAYKRQNVTFTNLHVWGEVLGRFLSLENKLYPFNGPQNDGAGRLHAMTFDRATFSHAPGQVSRLAGYTAANQGPFDIELNRIDFAGTMLRPETFDTYFVSDNLCKNIRVNRKTVRNA